MTRYFFFTAFLVSFFGFFVMGTSAALAATIYSNSTIGNDSTGDGSSGNPYKTFHKAYTEAGDGDTINLSGTFTWTDSGESGDVEFHGYQISKNLIIVGQGASGTIIQAAANNSSGDRRVFTIKENATVTIRGLTVRHGRNATSYTGREGGGIHVEEGATLIVEDSRVTNNYVSSTSWGGFGGGIHNKGTLTVLRSTIDNNFAFSQGSGVLNAYIANSSNVSYVTNSTIAFNSTAATVATVGGAGLYVRSGTMYVTNSTVAYNDAPSGTGDTTGIDIVSGATAHIKNSIFAENLVDGSPVRASSGNWFDVTNSGTLNDNGGNIFGKVNTAYSGVSFHATTWYDLYGNGVGNAVYRLASDAGQTGSLYLATELADNNTTNDTVTFALTDAGSIAIDNGQSSANSLISIPSTDQRNLPRAGSPDIGAYEYGVVADSEPPTVSLTMPINGATVSGSSVTLSADAEDETAMGGVTFYINNIAVGSEDTSAPYSIVWDSTSVASGQAELVAVARDAAGNVATSAARTIIVDNEPAPSTPSVTASSTGVSLSWETNAPGSTRIFYGLLNSSATSTEEINTGGDKTTNHSISLGSLPTCTFYKYRTINNSGSDIATSTEQTFQTQCTGSAAILTSTSDSIIVGTGGSLSHDRVTLSIPSGVTATTTDLIFQINALNSNDVISVIGKPNNKTNLGGIFHIKALYDETVSLIDFNEVIEITLSYDGLKVDETSLFIGRYDGNQWHNLGGVIDTVAKTITTTTTTFSDWGIFGDELPGAENLKNISKTTGTSFVNRIQNMLSFGNVSGALYLITQDKNVTNRYLSEIILILREYLNKLTVTNTQTVTMIDSNQTVRNLEIGMEGDDVRKLQQLLIVANAGPAAMELARVGATGYFGISTKYALDEYQHRYGIYPRGGYFGPITRTKMKEAGVEGLWW